MKKLLRGVSIALVLMLLLSVTALAYATPTDPGIYGVDWTEAAGSVAAGWKVWTGDVDPKDNPDGIASTDATIKINNVDTNVTFYAKGAKVNFTLTGLTPGSQKLVMGLNKKASTPVEKDIEYIDQGTVATDGTVTFTVYPKAASGTIYVYVDDPAGGALKQIGEFSLYQPYMLGDVNGDKAVNSTDALWVLQYTAHSPIRSTLTPTQFLAADVNKDGSVNSTDALWILQYTAHSPLRPSL